MWWNDVFNCCCGCECECPPGIASTYSVQEAFYDDGLEEWVNSGPPFLIYNVVPPRDDLGTPGCCQFADSLGDPYFYQWDSVESVIDGCIVYWLLNVVGEGTTTGGGPESPVGEYFVEIGGADYRYTVSS